MFLKNLAIHMKHFPICLYTYYIPYNIKGNCATLPKSFLTKGIFLLLIFVLYVALYDNVLIFCPLIPYLLLPFHLSFNSLLCTASDSKCKFVLEIHMQQKLFVVDVSVLNKKAHLKKAPVHTISYIFSLRRILLDL